MAEACVSEAGGSDLFRLRRDVRGLGRPHVVLTGYGSPCGSGTILSQAQTNYESCGRSPLGKMYQQEVPHVPNAEHVATTSYTYDGIGRTLAATVGSDTKAPPITRTRPTPTR